MHYLATVNKKMSEVAGDVIKIGLVTIASFIAIVGTIELIQWSKRPKFSDSSVQRKYEEALLRMEIEKKRREFNLKVNGDDIQAGIAVDNDMGNQQPRVNRDEEEQ